MGSKFCRLGRMGALASLAFACVSAAHAERVKVAFIDPFSGPFASLSQSGIRSFRVAEEFARREKGADVNTIDFVEFDNKISSQESLNQLKIAIEQGYRYVVQGVGSGATAALIDALNKHNERNPGKEVILINWTAGDPDLTNQLCSFWHFRIDLNADMKMEALTTYLAKNTAVKKVYLLNQNFAVGQQAAKAARLYLPSKRPDIQIVGDDLIPGGQVKDFTPYIAKIRASGADSVISSNSGVDLALLIKAAKEAALNVDFYTFNAQAAGVPTAMGSAGADRVKNSSAWHPNIESFAATDQLQFLKKTYDDDLSTMSGQVGVSLLRSAFQKASSTDPVKVAFALEGMRVKSFAGEVEMRKTDHQLQQPLYIAVWTKVDGKAVKFDQEKTGYGWKTEQKLDNYISSQPTSCQMKRPKG